MLYSLFEYLDTIDFPGAGVFHYISFRSACAVITSLIISMLFGKRLIQQLQKKQIGEVIRDLGLEGQMQKKGTPTMGGLIILLSILVPTLLFGDLTNVYVQLILFTTVALGAVGFVDDYIKVFKKNKEGLAGNFKIAGQVTVGLVVGLTLFFHPDVKVVEPITDSNGEYVYEQIVNPETGIKSQKLKTHAFKSMRSNVPFLKNNEIDYSKIISFLGEENSQKWAWIPFVIVVVIVVTAVSNSANLTDGIDGLATGLSAIIGATLGILAYLSGNFIYADYLNIMYLPSTGELVIFMSAFIGATVGFLWYNSFPAQVFMGDTGSLALGGIIAVFAIMIRKELLIPILCGIFLMESLSVIIQVSYFKYTKKKYGEGRRVFKMSPLHHHYQKLNYPEPKIVTRFWIIGILLAIITIITLKIR